MSFSGGTENDVEVALVDPHAVLRDALADTIARRGGYQIVGRFDGLGQLATLPAAPRVVVTDLELPDARGTDVVQTIAKNLPGAGILALTTVGHPSLVVAALDAGALGYVLKTAPGAEFFTGLAAVAAKESYVQPAVSDAIEAWRNSNSGYPTLSAKETDVLRRLALGHTNAEIAELTGVSLRTVETHRARIFQKLGFNTRAQLVRYAFAAGVVTGR